MFEKNNSRVLEFIVNKIKEAQTNSQYTSDEMERLRLAASQVSYAHLLSQYMQNSSYVFGSLMRLAKAYMSTESYEEAIIQARLAKKQAIGTSDGSKEKALLLIAECMTKQNRYEDACEILTGLEIASTNKQCERNYYELLMNVLVQLGQESKAKDIESKFQQLVLAEFGQTAIQFGYFLIKKGKSLGKFGKYDEALQNLRKGMDILIDLKCKDKKQITSIYLLMADYEKKMNNLQRQYSSLICAHAMAKQLEQPQKTTLNVLHALASNLIERQEYQGALKELKKAKELEKQIYGQSSVQMAKTTKKISEMLTLLNMKGEARKCEQEYSRIISSSGVNVLKQRANNG